MANRQIDPDGAFMHGYDDGRADNPRNCPYFDREQQSDYRNGYNAAKLAEREPV